MAVKVIAIASAKGGVGKSTTTACLAGYYAAQGLGVHIVDVTPKRTVTRWLGTPHSPTSLITLSTPPEPEQLDGHLSQIIEAGAADIILIDVAGAFEQTALIAMARANFSIVPMKPNEADINEGLSLIRNAVALYKSFGKTPAYRVLVTMVQPVTGGSVQSFGFAEIQRLGLPRFDTCITQRAVYAEIGVSHQPPHFADPKRGDPVLKARAEIATLADEIDALVALTIRAKAVA